MVDATEDPLKTPNPGLSMLLFFIVTSIYCVISIFLNNSMQRMILKVCYVLMVIIGQFFINLSLTESMCGITQWTSTLFITVIPWLIIFVVLQLFLTIFPGWLGPFSNTFGYAVAKMMGLPDLMKEILEPSKDIGVNRALESVRTDNALFVNELHTEPDAIVFEKKRDPKSGQMIDDEDKPKKIDGRTVYERKKFNETWEKLAKGGILKDFKDPKTKDIYRNRLYGFVQMKNAISEYVWNLLTGFFVTSVSYNYILNTGCSKSPKEMQERYNAYQAQESKAQKEKKEKEEKETTYVQTG